MPTSQREPYTEHDVVALVELDMQELRLRFFIGRKATRERLRELERPRDRDGRRQGIEDGRMTAA